MEPGISDICILAAFQSIRRSQTSFYGHILEGMDVKAGILSNDRAPALDRCR